MWNSLRTTILEIKFFRLINGEALFNMRLTNVYLLTLLVTLGSCVSYDAIVSFDEPPKLPEGIQSIDNYQPLRIQPNDLLQISISSADPLAVAPFVAGAAQSSDDSNQSSNSGQSFLIDQSGYIKLPTVGKILLTGLTTEEASEKIQEALKPYFEDQPIIVSRLLNFKINVSGEVGSPGSFDVAGERATILEAIIRAGDFTEYSLRDSVLVIRETNNERVFGYVDFNSAEVFSSPYFYLKQNDVIYVKPDKTKIGQIRSPATNYLPWVSAGTSIIALIVLISRRT